MANNTVAMLRARMIAANPNLGTAENQDKWWLLGAADTPSVCWYCWFWWGADDGVCYYDSCDIDAIKTLELSFFSVGFAAIISSVIKQTT